MAARGDRIVGFEDLALFVDEVTDALGIAGLRVVTGAVGKAQGPAGIAQQGKGKAELLREGGVLCHRVETRPQDFHIAGAKLSDLVAEPATLGGSPRGVGFGIEP